MKQLLQYFDSGKTELADAPVPVASGPRIVVETRATVVSAGTERMLVEFGRASLLGKVRSQPEKVVQVLDKVRTDGLGPTLDAVRSKLAAPIPLGYCQAGVVVEVGGAAAGYSVGDRVITNGPHAEYVKVPVTLAARIPDGVTFEQAAFTPLAAIGLQGIRLAQPELGETVVVFGLGLIGLLTAQMLRANGCRVIGIDRSADRLALAARWGVQVVDGGSQDPVAAVLAATGGTGADAVLLTLATDDDGPMAQAAAMSRQRGRLVLVGTTGLGLSRDAFYKKELSFSVSCSYGPGRYDPRYEEGGQDYPPGFVRWTAQRNFDAVLALIADGRLDVQSLITHRFPFDRAPEAYEVITGGAPSLGVVLEYPDRGGVAPAASARRVESGALPATGGAGRGHLVIGAGNFAVRTLLPLLQEAGADLRAIVTSGGPGGAVAARQFGIPTATTDTGAALADPSVASVFVLTRHDSHASLTLRALEAGKHVFVEKPLALTEPELDEVVAASRRTGRMVMVGFNRRFAPLAIELGRELAGRSGPAALVLTVNAGAIPRDHWTQDPVAGGGRIVGEACHFIDLARALVRSPIVDLQVTVARDQSGRPVDDLAHLALTFADGSTAVIHYLANGSASYPKERVEAFVDGRVLRIDNWRRLERFGRGGGKLLNLRRSAKKGHLEEVQAWVAAVAAGGPSPIPLEEIEEVSRWAIRAGALARGVVSA
jgi:predicted dehydrogenase/threonine dehydrogenase-like Zn-dependent dehydrogenase